MLSSCYFSSWWPSSYSSESQLIISWWLWVYLCLSSLLIMVHLQFSFHLLGNTQLHDFLDLMPYSFLYPFLVWLKFSYLFTFGCAGLCCCMRAFSSCVEWRLLFSAVQQASHCSGFSCLGAQSWSTWTVVVVAHGLWQMESSQTRDPTHVVSIGR